MSVVEFGALERGPVKFIVCEKQCRTNRGNENAHIVFCHSGTVLNSAAWFDITSTSHPANEMYQLMPGEVSTPYRYTETVVGKVLPILAYYGWTITHMDLFGFDRYRHNLQDYNPRGKLEILPPLIPISSGGD